MKSPKPESHHCSRVLYLLKVCTVGKGIKVALDVESNTVVPSCARANLPPLPSPLPPPTLRLLQWYSSPPTQSPGIFFFFFSGPC